MIKHIRENEAIQWVLALFFASGIIYMMTCQPDHFFKILIYILAIVIYALFVVICKLIIMFILDLLE